MKNLLGLFSDDTSNHTINIFIYSLLHKIDITKPTNKNFCKIFTQNIPHLPAGTSFTSLMTESASAGEIIATSLLMLISSLCKLAGKGL